MGKRVELTLYSITAWLLQHLIYYLCRWYFFLFKDGSVTASPLLKQVRKPVVLAVAPHLSHTDVVIVPAAIPIHLLPVRWLADKKIFKSRLKTFWLKLWGAIPIDRGQSGSIECEDIQWIVDYARKGKCIGVFPECCLVGGRFGDPHRDLVVTALENCISVLPVALSGTARPETSSLIASAKQKTRVSIGHPLSEATELLDELTS